MCEPVRALRRGNQIHVTLRLARRLPSEILYDVGGFDRRANVEPLATATAFAKAGQREFTTTLPAKGVRWVAVVTGGKRTFVSVSRVR